MSPPQSQEPPAISLSRWARIASPTAIAVTVLCSVTLAFYHGLWQPDLVLIKREAYRYFLPLKQHLIERLSAGELPQWFPYEALGCPFLGVSGIGIFHPFTALYFLLPAPDAYRVSTLVSCLLAALGAFALGRVLHFSRAGALIAGIAFALSGYIASLTENILYLYSLCTLPFFCAALEKALGESRAWVVAPAAVWATVFLDGDIQTGYYFGLIAMFWVAARATGSYREAGLRLALTGGLTILLAGVQLGPSWAFFTSSERVDPTWFHGQVLRWSTHPLRLMTIIASPVGEGLNLAFAARFFFGNPDYGLWAESLYLGVPVTGLALLGAWHRRDLRVLTLLGSLTLLLSLGRYGGLYEIFYHVVPFWSAFRYPEKLMGVVSFAAAMLAGAGLDALRANRGHPLYWFAAAMLCAGAGLGLRTDAAGIWTAASLGASESLARGVTSTAGLAFLYSAAAAGGIWLILAGARRGYLREALVLGALTALLILDLGRANLGAYHTGPAQTATFVPPLLQAIAAREGELRPGRFRLVSIPETMVALPPRIRQSLGYDGVTSVERRQALDLEHNAQFHLESARRYLDFSAAFAVLLQHEIGFEAAARYNVAYYISRRGRWTDPRFAQAHVAELPEYDLALVRNPAPAKPRVYLSRHPERATSLLDPTALLARSDFLNGDVDVIETSDAQLPGPASEGTAMIEWYAPEDVRVRVETTQPAVLVLLDSFDKGWTASLENGTKLPILRANALVRAVVVPAGAHVVTFSYQTPLLMAGAWASVAGVLLCIGLLMHARWRTRSTPVDT